MTFPVFWIEEDRNNGKTLREMSLAHLNAPTLMINTRKGKRFDHPLGEHYKELKDCAYNKRTFLFNKFSTSLCSRD